MSMTETSKNEFQSDTRPRPLNSGLNDLKIKTGPGHCK